MIKKNKIDLVKVLSGVNIPALSPKKLNIVNSLNGTDKIDYLLSLAGKKTKISIERPYENKCLNVAPKNRILELFKRKCSATSGKSPASKLFHFGIEIECILPLDAVGLDKYDVKNNSESTTECSTCEGRGRVDYVHRDSGTEISGDCPYCEGSGEISCDDDDNDNSELPIEKLQSLFKDLAFSGCHIKSDGSIDNNDDDFFGVEIAVLTSDFKNLDKICRWLNNNGAIVNSSCGLHVHLDARSFNYPNDLNSANDSISYPHHKLLESMDYLKEMLPSSRSSSTYCKSGLNYNDRYYAVNLTALNKFKTIEIRSHSGTTSFDKIKNWCDILKTILMNSPKNKVNSFNNLLSAYDFSEKLKEYMISRRSLFNTMQKSENNINNTIDEAS